jgi:hypothetical protein
MPTTSMGRESCRGNVQNARSATGARVWRGCYADGPGPSPIVSGYDAHGLSYTRHAGRATRPRNWETDPAGLQAKADALGLEVAALLCRGCENRRQRLIGEGKWPA